MQAERQQRERDIELKLAVATAGRDRGGESLGVVTHLDEHFAHYRVDLAGHDGRARLGGRQAEFAEAGARPRPEQADVAGELGQARGNGGQQPGHLDAVIARALRLEMIGGLAKRQAGLRAQDATDAPGKFRVSIEPGADRSSPDGEFAQHGHGAARPGGGFAGLRGVAGKFLAQRERRGVHQVRAADLYDAGKLGGFLFQRRGERIQRGHQLLVQHQGDTHVEGRRDDVIGRLAQIHVIVRMHGPLRADRLPGQLAATVGDDLVGVRVGRGARPGLEHIDGKLAGELADGDFAGGLFNKPGLFGREPAQFGVGAGAGELDQAQGANEGRRQRPAADGEIQDGPLRGGAVERIVRDGQLAHRITFDSHAGRLSADRRKTKTKRPAGKAGRT